MRHQAIEPGRAPWVLVLAVAALTVGLATPALAAKDLRSVPGYVDGNVFLECAGEEALTVEIRLSGTLLRMACSFDPKLCEAIKGVEMIHAVILDVSELPENAGKCLRDRMLDADKKLMRSGWERIAFMKEGGEELRVLILAGETTIEGLVVMAIGDEEIVFTNIAGPFDMAAFQRLIEDSDLPGIEDLDFEQLEKERKNKKTNGKD